MICFASILILILRLRLICCECLLKLFVLVCFVLVRFSFHVFVSSRSVFVSLRVVFGVCECVVVVDVCVCAGFRLLCLLLCDVSFFLVCRFVLFSFGFFVTCCVILLFVICSCVALFGVCYCV